MEKPTIPNSVFIAPTATVIGNITLGENVSVYYGAAMRAESEPIFVDDNTNIQDCCVFHTDEGFPIRVGTGCTIGHGAIVHGCIIGNNTLIGMGAIVLNGAVIGDNCIIGAGALVPQGTIVPDGSLMIGFPAKVKRSLTEDEIAGNCRSAEIYRKECAEYKKYEESR